MSNDLVMFTLSDMLLTALMVCGPLLLVVLVIGLLVSIFQVITQIQEMSLQFIPKLMGFVLAIFLLGHWLLQNITQFAIRVWTSIPNHLF